jgi:hypothetical protein
VNRTMSSVLYGAIIDKKIIDFESAFRSLQSNLTNGGVLEIELTTVRTLKIVEKMEGKIDDIRQSHLFFPLPTSFISHDMKIC